MGVGDRAYEGRTTVFVALACVVAAASGCLICGYDIGNSGDSETTEGVHHYAVTMKRGLPPSGARNPKGRSRASSRVQTPERSQPGTLGSAGPPGPTYASKLLAFDRRFSKWVHKHCLTDFTYAFLRFFEYSGDGLFWLPATAAFWLSPKVGPPETRMFVFNLFIGLIFDLIVVGCIKAVVKRKRPTYNRGHLVVVSMDHWSFPSGHSTRALMIVTSIWLYLPMWRDQVKRTWFPYLVYLFDGYPTMTEIVLPGIEVWLPTIASIGLVSWVLATTASRVVLGRHYLLDVIGGVVIGILETLVAHLVLHVPLETLESQHAWILARFGLYKEYFWNLLHERGFSTFFKIM